MDQLSRISIFIEVAKQESFAGAARKIGITTSAVSKQIQNLEHALKVKLFHRTTRNVSLTEEGALFYERTRHALDDIEEAKEQLIDLQAKPHGTIKISVPAAFGSSHLKKPLAQFAAKYPEVTMNVSFDDRTVNITEEGYDLAIRIGSLEDSSMIARKLISADIIVCASPTYLKDNKAPLIPDDLNQHNVIAYTRNKGSHEWRYQTPAGKTQTIKLSSRFKADSADMMIEAALNHLGIVIIPALFVKQYIDNGDLVTILDEYKTSPERNVYAIFPPNRYLSTRVRLLIEHLDQFCQNI